MGQTIRELMTTRLVKLDADRPVAEAARAMREKDVGDVLVMRGGKLAGILTDRDIVVRCIAADEDPSVTPLEHCCSPDLATLSPDEEVENAVRLMQKKAIRRIPVVEGDQPVGIVSLGDLAIERDSRSALGGISSARPNR